MSQNFVVLPPRFRETDKAVKDAVYNTFEGLPEDLDIVVEHALASLVFHAVFLKRVCDPDHKIFGSYVFQVDVLD